MPVQPQVPAVTSPAGRGGRAQKIPGFLAGADFRAGLFDKAVGLPTAIFVLTAIFAAGLQQGGFFVRGQLAAAALLAAALVTALPIRRALDSELRVPFVAAALVAGWTLIRAPVGSWSAAASETLLLVGLATVLILCRRLDWQARRLMVIGLLAFGALLALTAWVGVIWRLEPWALSANGLWRGASTITYANALAGVLVPLSLVALALLSARRRSVPLALALAVVLLGLATTLSRAGALALLVGIAVLVLIRGLVVVRALLPPLTGASVAFAGLAPSMPVDSQPRPGLAVLGLVVGIGLTAALVSGGPQRTVAALAALFLIVGFGSWSLAKSGGPLGSAAHRISEKRVQVSDPPRARLNAAALHLVAQHPLTGVGPGRVVLESKRHGRLHVQQYVHDEYVQLLAEVGAIGLALVVALMAAIARLLWRSRSGAELSVLWAGTVAACAAAAVHAGFDFVWHVPVVLLTLAVLIGLAVKPATSVNERDLTERRL